MPIRRNKCPSSFPTVQQPMALTRYALKPTTKPEMATKLKLKLLVDQRSNCVVLAEAGKDVVDFLFDLLELPFGLVTRLLSNDLEAAGSTSILGSIGMLYGSVEALDDAYFIRSAEARLALVNPQFVPPIPSLKSLLLENVPSSARPAKNYYCCCETDYHDRIFMTDASGTPCPICGEAMTEEMEFVAGAGYVKESVTYMLMDDLSVTPMSSITAIAMLNKLHAKDASSLYEWNVELGMKEGLDLLEASLNSTTILTDVFLGKSKSGVPVD